MENYDNAVLLYLFIIGLCSVFGGACFIAHLCGWDSES